MIDESGLEGLTITNDYVETYYTKDPTNVAAIEEFRAAADRAKASLGNNARRADKGLDRFWAYGDGAGATNGFGEIRGKLYPPKGDKASATALRVATRFAGREFDATSQAPAITENQVDIQREIAVSHPSQTEMLRWTYGAGRDFAVERGQYSAPAKRPPNALNGSCRMVISPPFLPPLSLPVCNRGFSLSCSWSRGQAAMKPTPPILVEFLALARLSLAISSPTDGLRIVHIVPASL